MGGVAAKLLGPFELTVGGQSLELSSPKQRAILAVLAIRSETLATTAEIVEAVWGPDAGPQVDHTLQQHISAIRKVLEPDRRPRAEPTVLLRRGPGYQLLVDDLDLRDFDALVAAARRQLRAERLREGLDLLDRASALWRGDAPADVRGTHWLDAFATRLDELHLVSIEDRADALLRLERYQLVVPELEALTRAHPYRERLHAQLMLALYGSDRQADALATYQRLRATLADELGLEPSPPVRALESAILAQDDPLSLTSNELVASMHDTFGEAQSQHSALRLPDGQLIVLREGTTLLGRAPEAQVRLSDSRVSRAHAQIQSDHQGHVLRDLDSTNGTRVNGEVVTEHQLSDADVISLGGVELVVVSVARGQIVRDVPS